MDKSVDICASTEVVVKNETTNVDKILRSKLRAVDMSARYTTRV